MTLPSCESTLGTLFSRQAYSDHVKHCARDCTTFSQDFVVRLKLCLEGSEDINSLLNVSVTRAQHAIDLLDEALLSQQAKAYKVKIHRILVKLARKSKKSPNSLFKSAIHFQSMQPITGGGFADIFDADLDGVKVAIKRLRSFITESWIFRWMHQSASGLQYLHEEGVIHGDLRGPNMLIDSDYKLMLTDFGLSVFSECTSHAYGSKRGGNPRWIAPELVDTSSGKFQRPTKATDVFSLSRTYLELCTGKPPYPELSSPQVCFKLWTNEHPERPSLPGGEELQESLWLMMQQCWSPNPLERPSALQLMEFTKELLSSHRS
ncbi:hypothetical protein EIP91_004672 [Steccherinum ochraceum]|uniref:Protein kinase domain-containing protein n=1 Tax=Steccherinum ochraceum TaxID=92696 RepID=A0A4R0RNS0_9APHY|nr:hypothetical protein EIP91_004672 [Steccherinum ochraceum]